MTDARRPRRLAVVGSAMLIFLLLAAPSQGTQHENSQPEETYGPDLAPVNPEEVRSVMSNLGVGENEAKLRLALATPIENLRQELMRRYGDAFAGLWYEPGPPWRIMVGLTRDAEQILEDVRGQFPRPRLLVAEQREWPLTELRAVWERAGNERHRLRAEGVDLRAVYPEHEINRVVIEVPERRPGDEERARAILESDAVVLRVQDEPPPTFQACGWLQCSSLRGGQKITTGASGTGTACSLGFGAKSKTDNAPYIITAAHCIGRTSSHNGVNMYANKDGVGWQLIGKHHAGQTGGDVDAAIIHEETANWSVNEYLIHSSTSTAYPINGVYLGTSLDTTNVLCGSGYVSTSPDCRNVMNGSWSGDVEGVWFNNVVVYGQCTADGDSGGPVYAGNGAYAVHFAGNGCSSTSAGWASYALNVETRLGVNICWSQIC